MRKTRRFHRRFTRRARSRSRSTQATALVTFALGLGVMLATAARPFATTCDKVASPRGADTASGTDDQPYRTIQRLVDSLHDGDTGCLRTGVYGSRGTVTRVTTSGSAGARIAVRAYPGDPMPRVLGQYRVVGDHVTTSGLLFDGPTGPIADGTASSNGGEDVQVWILGEDAELSESEIRDNRWHAGVYLYEAANARIVGNYIHDNGQVDDPTQANFDHGIYWDSGSGLVANNVITHNYASGVQLYPSATDVTITHNAITRNGRSGVIVSNSSSNNLIAHNVISGNDEGVRSDQLTGRNNTARANILWGNTRGNISWQHAGLALIANFEVDGWFSRDYDPAALGNDRALPTTEGSDVIQAMAGWITHLIALRPAR